MYGGMEIMFDNSSDKSMVFIGALAFIIGGEFSIKFKNMSVRLKSFWIANIITSLEFIGGLIFNQSHNIWDYSHIAIGNIPLNFMGQICLPFWIIWFLIAPLIIWLTDKLIDEKIDLCATYKRLFDRKG